MKRRALIRDRAAGKTSWWKNPLVRESVQPYRLGFLIVWALELVGIGLSLVQAGALRSVFDGLQVHRLASVRQGMVVFGGALLAASLSNLAVQYGQSLFGARVSMAIRIRALDGLLAATMGFHDQHVTGDLASRLSADVGVIGRVMSSSLLAVISNPVLLVASTLYLWTMSPLLAVLILPVGPILLVAQRLWKDRLYQTEMAVRAGDGELNHTTLEIFRGMAPVKSYQIEGAVADRYGQGVKLLTAAYRRSYGAIAQLNGITRGLGSLPFVAVVVVGGLLVRQGRFELGTLIAAIQLSNGIVGPFAGVSSAFTQIQSGRAALARIQVIAGAPPESPELKESGGAPSTDHPPRIVCEGLQFGYDDQAVLRGLSLVCEPGTLTAVMGPNGGGKTTLAKLLLRFYPPESGQIWWDQYSWDQLGTAWVRAHLVYVAQDLFLVQESVADNLRLLVPDASEAQLHRVLTRVGLPTGPEFLDRAVGEAGRNLSGGQRLRLSIARALLRDRPFWILDEPTAALDPEGIQAIAELIRDLTPEHTVMVITHSREVAELSNQVVVVSGGVARVS